MKEIKAYKCELTGQIFDEEARARQYEFRSMMKSIGRSLPHMGSVNSASVMEWLADNITSRAYPAVADKLTEALSYYAKHIRPDAQPEPVPFIPPSDGEAAA